jgi:hypothetical protein
VWRVWEVAIQPPPREERDVRWDSIARFVGDEIVPPSHSQAMFMKLIKIIENVKVSFGNT